MLVRGVFSCFVLSSSYILASAGVGQFDENNKILGALVRKDVFFAAETSDEPSPHYLRRQLQQSSCIPLQYGQYTGDCSGTYPCTCNGVAAECPFCEVTTTSAEGTVCQQSGESSTFTFNTDSPQLMVCTCNYYGSGSVNQTCVPQAAVLDTLVPALPPLPSAGPAPTAAPGTKAPGTGEGTLTPEVPNPSLTGLGCHAIIPYNVRICLSTPEQCAQYGASCDIMGQHSCACTGSSDTMCSYCQVQTATETFCQVVGSSSTFTGLDGVKKTCTCDYAGNGQATQTCTPVPTMDISEMP